MQYFLLTYDLTAGRLLPVASFSDRKLALDAYAAAERLHRGDPFEIVLLTGESEESLKRTHGSYWMDPHEVPDFTSRASA